MASSVTIETFTSGEQKNLCILIAVSVASYLLLKTSKLCPGKELYVVYPIVSAYSTFRSVYVACESIADGSIWALTSTTETRLHSPHEGFNQLAEITFAYEVWNTMCALILSEYRTPAFVGHHLATGLLAKLAQQPYAAFYGLFFFGFASASSCLLCIVDIFRYGPPAFNEAIPTVNLFFRVLFAFAFLFLRSFIWPILSLVFWYDVLGIEIQGGDGKQKTYVAVIFLIANTGLSFLQVLWTDKIWSGLSEVLFASPDKEKKTKVIKKKE